MTQYSDADRTVALGGVFQAARLARDIARNGMCDAAAFEASRESLFDFTPASVIAVFGGAQGIALGLQSLSKQLAHPQQRDLEESRYVIALLHLTDRLVRSGPSMQKLHDDLTALGRRRDHIELAESVQHEQLAQIYQDRISVLGPRIIVRGEPLHLQNPENTARIRIALLAGIRAAVLWRQAGGKKWQMLLRRRKIIATARELVHETDRDAP
ncbi:MAG: high frequency lysogenization protein HflD [Sedimenticolaceae bacterium]